MGCIDSASYQDTTQRARSLLHGLLSSPFQDAMTQSVIYPQMHASRSLLIWLLAIGKSLLKKLHGVAWHSLHPVANGTGW